MKNLIIIPTLNEEKNINILFKKLKKLKIKSDILFIDDNSQDKSQEIIKYLSKKNKFIKFIFRSKKKGIGSAHKEGFKWCYRKKYKTVVTMDADGTHDPKDIKLLLSKLMSFDIAITNRFLKRGSLKGWPKLRIFVTYTRHIIVSILLNISIDSSGAFRCINCKKVKLSDLIKAKDNGYSYFWESIFILHRKKYKIAQVGSKLIYRKQGTSNIKFKDIYYAIYYLLIVFIKKMIGKYNYNKK